MSRVLTLDDVAVAGQRVLIREDLNVPLADGEVVNDARIQAALPTIARCLEQGALVMVMSHLGRPAEGAFDPALSLAPVAKRLSDLAGVEVQLTAEWQQGVSPRAGVITLLENVRFADGEKANADALAKRLAGLCDVFVMDAFATAHRAQASTHGVAKFAPIACAGPLLQAELEALTHAMDNPARPLVAVVGGSKVSTKLEVLEALADLADHIIVGGGIANTFALAWGHAIGRSLAEPDLVETAKRIAAKVDVPRMVDVMTAGEMSEGAPAVLRPVGEIPAEEMVLDIGPETARQFASLLANAGTIIWNGPLGVFEYDQFGEGTRVVAEAIAQSGAFSLAGGGDTLHAIDKYQVRDAVSYISTGGGAFLEFVEGKKLPAVAILEERAEG